MRTHARSAVRLARAGAPLRGHCAILCARPLLLVLAEKGEASIGRRCGSCAGGLCVVLMARSTASRLTVRGGKWRKDVLCIRLYRGMAAVAHLHTVDSNGCANWESPIAMPAPPGAGKDHGCIHPRSAPSQYEVIDHSARHCDPPLGIMHLTYLFKLKRS